MGKKLKTGKRIKARLSGGKLEFKKLRISNMVVTGKFLFKRRLNLEEYNKLVMMGWMSINDEVSPILSKVIEIRKKEEASLHGRVKQPYVSIWTSGAINIVGVVSMSEARKVYDIVLKDLKKVNSKNILNSEVRNSSQP